MSDLISVTINDGKYTIQQTGPGNWECLHHGEPWPAFDGVGPDNFHVALAYEIHKLRREVAHMSKPTGTFAWALHQMLWEQAEVIREAEPHIDYSFDGADGCAFWRLDREEDELDKHAFTCEQILASDWQLKAIERPTRRPLNLLAAANAVRQSKAVAA